MSNQIQSSNITKFFVLNFDVHLTFACLPAGNLKFGFMELHLVCLPTVRLMRRCGKRQNSDVTCPFNGGGYFSLMLRTISRDSSRDDLPSLCNEVTKNPGILIVDIQLLIRTESTDLSPYERFPLSFGGWLFSRLPHLLLLSLLIHLACE